MRRCLTVAQPAAFLTLILFLFPCCAAGQDPGAEPRPIRVDVRLVLLPTRVADPNGKSIVDLGPQDFRVLEDGEEQKLEFFALTTEPAHIAILVDTSGSTHELLPELRNAAQRFVDRFTDSDQIALYGFDVRVTRVHGFTNDLQRVKQAIGRMETVNPIRKPKDTDILKAGDESAGTLLYDAVAMVRKEFPPGARKRAILIFTDSWDIGSETTYDSLSWQVLRGSEMVFAVIADLRQTEGFGFLKRPGFLDAQPRKKKDPDKRQPMTWAVIFDFSNTPPEGAAPFLEVAQEFLKQLGRRDRVWLLVHRQRLYPLAFPSFTGGEARARALTADEARQLLPLVQGPPYVLGAVSRQPVMLLPEGTLLLTDRNESGLPDLTNHLSCPPMTFECPVAIVKPEELNADERKAVINTFVNDPEGQIKLAQLAFSSVLQLMERRLTRLVTESGGESFVIRRAKELTDTYQQIADQIRSSFLLGYYTAGAPGYHRLQVAVPGRESAVKSRQAVIVQ